MDEFDNGDFNIDDILNDKELQRELRSLGFAEPEMRERTTPQQNGIPHSEVDMINVAADDNDIAISLDENDLDDPELLQQFEQLNGIEHTEVTTDLEPNNRNEEKFVNVSKTISNAEEFSAEDPPIEKVQIAEDAKALALYWKRAGNNDLALKWFRHAKAINASVLLPSSSEKSNARSKHTAKGSNSKQESQELKPDQRLQNYQGIDEYTALENALSTAIENCLKEAKANRETNAKLAADKMRSYKYYKQELDVLYSRKAAKQKPPLFHWQTDVREVVVENLDIGEDQFKLSIDGAYDLEGALDGHSSRSISISYLTGLLKEESKVVVGPANYTEGKVLFSYEIIVNGLKRSKNARILYGRKKATFELTLNRGFFRSSVDFARSEIALEELLSKSECGGVLPLYGISKDGKKSKAVGGSLKVTIKLRSPLAGRELRKITDRTLIVEEWPIGENFLDQQKVELEKANEKFGVADAPQPIIQKEQSKSPLTEQEIHDPHAVDFLESNEVLEAEIRIVSSALQTSDLDEDSKFEASMRLQLLQTKLQILTLSVQQERISFEEYLDMLRVRIVRDKEMAIYFKNRKEEDPVNLQHALRIMRRIKLMEEELKEAEESV